MGAVLGLAAAAVVAGGSAYMSTESANSAAENQANFQNQSSKSAAAHANRQAKDTKHNLKLQGKWLSEMPQLNFLDLGPSSKAFNEFLSQKKYLPRLAGMATMVNKADNEAFQSRISELAPGLLPALQANSETLLSYAKGEVPDDVKGVLARESAQRALMGGYSPSRGDTGPTRMAEDDFARNFGLTSMALKDKAIAALPTVLQSAQAMNPSNVSAGSLLFSPSAILGRQDQQGMANWQVGNQNLDRAWQARYGTEVLAKQKVTPGYVNTTPVQAQTENPWVNAGMSAAGTFVGGYGAATAPSGTGAGLAGNASAGGTTPDPTFFQQFMKGFGTTYNG